MTRPDLQTFKALANQGNLIPVYREILGDTETPVSAYLKLNRRPSFLLESVVGGEKWARYSFLGIDPALTITHSRGRAPILHPLSETTRSEAATEDPLAVVEQILRRYRPVPVPGLPRFSGGFVGYVGYDTVKSFERVPDLSRPGIPAPDVFLMLADTMLIFDNLKQTIKVLSNVHLDGRPLEEAYGAAAAKIDAVIEQLRTCTGPPSADSISGQSPAIPAHYGDSEFSSNFAPEAFLDAVSRAKEYVMAGDVVQVVLSQRFETRAGGHPFDMYRALRVINPSPYMYYIDIGELQLVGSSPEILVRLEGDNVTLRPIAGTRKRGETEDEDLALEEELRKDPKEMAEHIMLVDLGRNDVGRVAEIGSVRVTELMNVERYSHVMHLVSNVEGKLRRGLDCFDVFRACFPAGTVTGAPKVRAMEIIEELEPTRRGPYAGAVGYFSYSGNMDTCITIRTLVIRDGRVYVQAGAGIVADSIPEREYMETVNKARAMIEAVDFLGRSPQCS
jgi:anthranilate synthase component 1